MISIKKSDDTKILIEVVDELPDNITLKYVVILITWIIKDGDKFYLPLVLKEAFVAQNLVDDGKMLVRSGKILVKVGRR